MQVKPNDTENVKEHRPQAVVQFDLPNAGQSINQSKLNVRMTEFFKVSAICVCLQMQCSFVAQYVMSFKNKHLDSLVGV